MRYDIATYVLYLPKTEYAERNKCLWMLREYKYNVNLPLKKEEKIS